MRLPTATGSIWVPCLGHRRASDPHEGRVEAHGDVHRNNDGPEQDLHPALHQTQESDGKGRLAPGGGQDRKRAGEVANQTESRKVLRRDGIGMLPEAFGHAYCH